jgi:hypothetical protein
MKTELKSTKVLVCGVSMKIKILGFLKIYKISESRLF